MMKPLNNKGAVLISVYMIMFILLGLSSSVALFNFSELRDARRYKESVAAFWLAEAGINQFMADITILDDRESMVIAINPGTIKLTRDDSDPKYRVITSLGKVDGSERQIQIKYPALTTIFESTVSTKGDLAIEGRKSSLVINDKLRLGGEVVNKSDFPLILIEDKEEGLNDPLVSIAYPDVNQNGITDEFDDFVLFNRNLIARYPEEEVIYIKGNDTYTIMPDGTIKDKKIVYIEGDREGEGNAVIQFTGAMGKDQNLTIIATGTVTHNQAGVSDKDSQLNIIAWADYNESSALPSVHNGMIYTHGTAYFDEVHDTSVTNGSVVANEGIVIGEIWSNKTFNYEDMRTKGVAPPGFEGLVGGSGSGYSQEPNSWKEIPI